MATSASAGYWTHANFNGGYKSTYTTYNYLLVVGTKNKN